MDTAGIIARQSRGATYTVTRRAADTIDTHGVRVRGASSPLSIVAVIVPADGDDAVLVPEGSWTKGVIAVYTATQLKVQDDSTGGDEVAFDGHGYQVQHVEHWVGGAYRALATRVS